eukprot:1540109-Lingulodinium_polyedra.AAC.1
MPKGAPARPGGGPMRKGARRPQVPARRGDRGQVRMPWAKKRLPFRAGETDSLRAQTADETLANDGAGRRPEAGPGAGGETPRAPARRASEDRPCGRGRSAATPPERQRQTPETPRPPPDGKEGRKTREPWRGAAPDNLPEGCREGCSEALARP